MKYLHTMVRTPTLGDASLFLPALASRKCGGWRMSRGASPSFSWAAPGDEEAQVELTHNWDEADYNEGRNFGHIAYEVDDVYETCRRLMEGGVTINRPPREGRMAFIRTPDNVSIELLQKGGNLPVAEPWASMENVGHW